MHFHWIKIDESVVPLDVYVINFVDNLKSTDKSAKPHQP